MSFFITLLASTQTPHLTPAHLSLVIGELECIGIQFDSNPQIITPQTITRLTLIDSLGQAEIESLHRVLAPHTIDILVTRSTTDLPPLKLLIADMDSTILRDETLDAIAAEIGIGAHVTEITARAMRGELDFRAALKARLDLIAGTPVSVLEKIWAETRVSPGAATLIQTLRAQGVTCVLVSGGFTYFTERCAHLLGFDDHVGNVLGQKDGVITADLTPPLIDSHAKLATARTYAQKLGISMDQVIAIGDGANDLPLLQSVGYAVAYRPKPILREHIQNQILYGDLTAALYAAGIDPASFQRVPDPLPR